MSLDKRSARRFITALAEECDRQKRLLRVPGFPKPFYISYLLRDIRTVSIWGRLGNINQITDQCTRNVYCDVRVGSYRYDQVTEGGLDDHDHESESYDHVEMPIGNDSDALKFHLWKLTDSRYRESVRQYLQKRSQHITYVDPNRDIPSFRIAKPIQDLRFKSFPAIDIEGWKAFVNRASRIAKHTQEIKNSWVEVRIRHISRLFVSSEGSRIIDQSQVCELSCDLWSLTAAGEGVGSRIVHVTPRAAELPDIKTLSREIRKRIALVCQLRDATTLKSYAGPVLLAPGPAGILFHEVLGHRLEGSRLLSTREGQTFARDLGKHILPRSITVIDDPTARRSAGTDTVASFRFDDEGSPAQRTVLVNRGKLVGFLSGRAPVMRRRVPANGHARSEHHERPISRMANLIIDVEGGVSHTELKEALRAQIKRQKLPFGIMVLQAEGGETATESYDFQAFMGHISLAVQIWADGRENLVRNLSFVGTPLSALRNIVAVGDTPVCENAFCGAESGVIPVSTTSPALLMSNLELQATDQRKYAQYVVPMPYEK